MDGSRIRKEKVADSKISGKIMNTCKLYFKIIVIHHKDEIDILSFKESISKS